MYVPATILNTATTSDWIRSPLGTSNSETNVIVGVYAPTGTSQTSCSIQGSFDGVNAFDVLDSYGNAKSFPISAGKLTDILPGQNPMVIPPFFRLVIPSAATADRTF